MYMLSIMETRFVCVLQDKGQFSIYIFDVVSFRILL